MEPLSNTPNPASDQGIQLEEQVLKYLKHWKWILFSVALALVAANVYVRYLIPQFGMSTTILIKDDKKDGSTLDAFSDLGILTSGKSNIENEIAIFQSRRLAENVVRELELNVSYIVEGRIISSESYTTAPLKVLFIKKAPSFYEKDTAFVIKPLSAKIFEVSDRLKEGKKRYSFGQMVKSSVGTFMVLKNAAVDDDFELVVTISSLKNKAASYSARLNVEPIGKRSTLLKLSMSDVITERGVDYLNAVVEQYNIDAANDKNLIAENTYAFIETRLGIITKELDSVEKGAESFKKRNKLTDLTTNAQMSLAGSTDYEKSVVQNETDLKVLEYMIDVAGKATSSDMIPGNVLSSGGSAGLIGQYNQLVLERARILKSATPSNPAVQKMDAQLEGIRANILESLQNEVNSLKIRQRDIVTQENIFEGKVGQVPTHERKYRIIERQQQIKESLYLYLLQKREETAISLAVTSPKAKVIDSAYPTGLVYPNKKTMMLMALLIGLLIPIGIIFLIDLLDNRIHSRQDIEKLTTIPYLGDIPLSDESKDRPFDPRSATAESFRIILTNLEFMLANVASGKAKTIFITSTMPREGKTFISINLAKTLALYGKKVVLIGMDLRHPKFSDYLDVNCNIGVSNFLSSDKYKLEDVMFRQKDFDNLWIMPSGAIPPNPAELLNSAKVAEIFDQLTAEFDYIVVDTAPVSLVTDTLLLKEYADVFVYAVRANYLRKNSLAIPQSLQNDKKLPNMAILLNGLNPKKAYGYGYGYGYGNYGYGAGDPEETPWFKKIFKK